MAEMKPIPYGRQNITHEDIEAVSKVLSSDFITQGPAVSEFEKKFAEYIGVKYAVACSNGTAALHLSALALEVKPGDRWLTTPITFSASANCIKYCGGEVDFVDIDPKTYLIDLDKLTTKLQQVPEGYYSGVVPVDFAGRAVDMSYLYEIAKKYNLKIIEDACHAPGGYILDDDGKKQFCGNAKYSDTAIFSFHPVKHIATGEGGMVTTNDEALYQKLLLYRTHGITKQEDLLHENHGSWYYEMIELGYNYRLTDIQAALGIQQLKRASDGVSRRREIAKSYYNSFKDKPFIKAQSGSIEGHAYHLYVIETDRRKELYEYLRSKNIYTQVHYIPVHFMPYYRQFGWKEGDLPCAEKYYSRCLSLPMFPTLSDKEQEYVIQMVIDFFK